MCRSIIVRDMEGGPVKTVISRIRDARRFFGRRRLVVRPGYPSGIESSHCCLCPLNVQLTAEASGYVYRHDVMDDEIWPATSEAK